MGGVRCLGLFPKKYLFFLPLPLMIKVIKTLLNSVIHPSLKAHIPHLPLHQHVLAIIISREKMFKRFPPLLIKESRLWDL